MNVRKKDHAFNVPENRKRIWKGSNKKVVYSNCGKPSHTKDIYF